jgi:hypothetical protein
VGDDSGANLIQIKARARVALQPRAPLHCSASCICSCALAFFGFTSAEKRRALGAGGLARIFAATLVGDGCRGWSVALVAHRQRLHDRYDRRDISRWIARPPMRSNCRRLFSAHSAAKVVNGAHPITASLLRAARLLGNSLCLFINCRDRNGVGHARVLLKQPARTTARVGECQKNNQQRRSHLRSAAEQARKILCLAVGYRLRGVGMRLATPRMSRGLPHSGT